MYAKTELIDKNTLKIDLHGLFVDEAKNILTNELNKVKKDIEKIVVVHGYNSGNNLKDMVHGIRNSKIKNIFTDFYNKGQSIIVLKKK